MENRDVWGDETVIWTEIEKQRKRLTESEK